MILNILHIDTSIDNLPLSYCHPVVVHLVKGEVSICMESLVKGASSLLRL